jgi:sec-independent protein translocase protein TatA
MGTFGPIHWLIVGIVLLLLFGNRLPSVMRSLGQGVVEFKKGMQGIEDDIKGTTTNRIEEQPNKPQAKEEAKPSEAEPVQR